MRMAQGRETALAALAQVSPLADVHGQRFRRRLSVRYRSRRPDDGAVRERLGSQARPQGPNQRGSLDVVNARWVMGVASGSWRW